MKHRKEKQKIETITVCPECNSAHLILDSVHGELVCQKCGLVITENHIDQGPEWRSFDSEQSENRARTGAPMTYTVHDKGLTTEISRGNRDVYGKNIPAKNRAQFYRLRKMQRRIRVRDAGERNLATALAELGRMAGVMGMPKVVRETAAMIYRKAMGRNLVRGRSINGVVATALYSACRQCNVPRTLDEIARVSRVDKKEIGRTYRFITHELKLKLMPTSPEDYIPRFCSELKLSGAVQIEANKILHEAAEKQLGSGKGPVGMAAAAIYIAAIMCNEERTQKEVADAAGVTEVTIRNRYKELTKKLGLKINMQSRKRTMQGGSGSRKQRKNNEGEGVKTLCLVKKKRKKIGKGFI